MAVPPKLNLGVTAILLQVEPQEKRKQGFEEVRAPHVRRSPNTGVSVCQWINTLNVTPPYNGILFSLQKQDRDRVVTHVTAQRTLGTLRSGMSLSPEDEAPRLHSRGMSGVGKAIETEGRSGLPGAGGGAGSGSPGGRNVLELDRGTDGTTLHVLHAAQPCTLSQ